MQSSAWIPKFLLDENVNRKLENYLLKKGINVQCSPKGIKNGKLALLAKSDERVLITNDSDFIMMNKEKLFSVIILKIPQHNTNMLFEAISSILLKRQSEEDYKGKCIILKPNKFEVHELP